MTRMPIQRGLRPPDQENINGHYANYQSYNSALRNWLVSFGFGGLAIFLVNDRLASRLSQAGVFKLTIALLFIGSASQVVLAVVNKYIAWHNYDSTANPENYKRWLHRSLANLSWRIGIDICCDFVSLVLFAVVIGLIIYVLLQPIPFIILATMAITPPFST